MSLLSSNDHLKPKHLMPPYNMKKVVVLPKLRNGDVPSENSNPITSEYKVNDYYNGFMRDHFLFEAKQDAVEAQEISAKLK